jgi:hypothetical protein
LPFDGTSELATGYSSAVVADLSLRDSNLPVCDILRFSGPGQVFSLPEDLAEPLTTTITFNRRFAEREKAPRSLKFRSADESDAQGIVREFVDTGNRHYMPRTHEVETEDVGWINITGHHWRGKSVVYKGRATTIHRTRCPELKTEGRSSWLNTVPTGRPPSKLETGFYRHRGSDEALADDNPMPARAPRM